MNKITFHSSVLAISRCRKCKALHVVRKFSFEEWEELVVSCIRCGNAVTDFEEE